LPVGRMPESTRRFAVEMESKGAPVVVVPLALTYD
jgi:hypothetical protein